MSDFIPGDKVSLLNEDVEGKVIAIQGNNEVIVELEDGIEIPVPMDQLVKLAGYSEEKKTVIETKKTDTKNEGLFLTYTYKTEQSLDLQLINSTPNPFSFAISEYKDGFYYGLKSSMLQPGTSISIKTALLSQFDEWPVLLLQGFYFIHKSKVLPPPIYYQHKPKASNFFKKKSFTDLLGKESHLYKIENEREETVIEIKTDNPKAADLIEADRPEAITDLHIEELISDYDEMTNQEILDFQMNYFENVLAKAIAFNYKRIIFIHGVGNGVLKNKIYNYLKDRRGIKNYSVADPKQFGTGAVEVIL